MNSSNSSFLYKSNSIPEPSPGTYSPDGCWYISSMIEDGKQRWSATSQLDAEDDSCTGRSDGTDTVASLLHDVRCTDSTMRLETSLKISNRKGNFTEHLASVLDSEYSSSGSRASLVHSAISADLDWLAELILDSTDASSVDEDGLYMFARKNMAGWIKSLHGLTEEPAGKNTRRTNRDLRMLFRDVKRTGNMIEIDVLQKKFGAVSPGNIQMFMNKELVFVLEHLSKDGEVRDMVAGHLEKDACAVEFAIRGYYESILKTASMNTLRSAVYKLMDEDKGLYLIPAIDFVLRRERGRKSDFRSRIDEDYTRFIDLVHESNMDELGAFLEDKEEYMYDVGILKWIVGKRKWDVLEMIVTRMEDGGKTMNKELDEDTVTDIVMDNRDEMLFRLVRCGYRVSTERRDVLTLIARNVNLKCVADIMGVGAYSVSRIGEMCMDEEWEKIENVRNMVEDKSELDRYVVSVGDDAATSYANYVCGFGNGLDRLKGLESEGARAGVDGANNACRSGSKEVLEHLFAQRIRPDRDGARDACARGHLEIVKYLSEKIRKILNNDCALAAARNGRLDVLEHLVDERVVSEHDLGSIYEGSIDDIYANDHLEVFRYLVGKKAVLLGEKEIGHACENGSERVLTYLAKDENVKLNSTECIKSLCKNGYRDLVRDLAYKGPSGTEEYANIACEYGHVGIVEDLWKYKDIHPNQDGFNRACMKGREDVVRFLWPHRKSITASCTSSFEEEYCVREFGETGVAYACLNGHLNLVKYLVTEENVHPGTTSTLFACNEGHMDIVKLLYERGVAFGTEDIDMACLRGHSEIVEYLTSRGVGASEDGTRYTCDNNKTASR